MPADQLTDDIRRQIVDHCVRALPNEGCGLLAVHEGRVMKVYPTPNEDASPVSYTIPGDHHYRALKDAERHGWELGGVFHSHPNGRAAMSSVDVERAVATDWLYVVVGLGDREPELSVASAPFDAS